MLGGEDRSNRSLAPTLITLVTVLFIVGFPFLSLIERPGIVFPIFTGSLVLLFVLALIFDSPRSIHIILITLLNVIWLWTEIWPSQWPFHFLFPLVVYAIAVALVPSLRKTVGWLHVGTFDRPVRYLVLLTVLFSSFALVVWFLLIEPDLSRFLMVIPNWSPALLILTGLGFALVNAMIEESMYRGILMQVLDSVLGAGNLSIIIQAIAFGLVHIKGIPEGWVGVGLATIYGLMVGFIRRCAQGMLAPFIAHVFADVVIFSILILWVK